MSLFRRLSLTMVALVLATAVAIWALAYGAISAAVVPVALDGLRLRTGPLAALIEVRSEQAIADIAALRRSDMVAAVVETASTGKPVRGWDYQQWRQLLAQWVLSELESNRHYAQIRLIGIADGGREIVRVDRANRDAPAKIIADADLQQKQDRGYFRDTLKLHDGETYLSDIDYNEERGVRDPSLPVLRVAAPVQTASGEPFGILIINIDMGPTFETLKRRRSEYSNLYLINSAGDFLIHPDRSREFQFERGEPYRLANEFPSLVALARSAAPVAAVADIAGSKAGVAVRPIDLGGKLHLTLISIQPEDVLFASVNAIRNSSLIGGGIALVCAMAAAMLFARWLARPLTQMTAAVAGLRSGSLFPLPVDAQGEIGSLAKAIFRLTEMEGSSAAAIAFSDEPAISTTLDGYITSVNRPAAELFNFEAAKVVGCHIGLLFPPGREDEFQYFSDTIRNGGRIENYKTERRISDGRMLRLSITVVPLKASDGTIAGWSAIYRDNSIQTRHHQRVRDMQIEAAHAERLNTAGEMAASIAHELNQPLAAMTNYMNSVLHRLASIDQPNVHIARDYVNKAIEQIQRAAKIVRGIRSFVGNRQVHKADADVAEVFNDGLDLALNVHPGLTIRRHISGGLPAVPLERSQIQQVIVNLVRNAVEAMENVETPVLVVTVVLTEAGWVQATFMDNGAGLPQDRIENLFQPFKSGKASGMGMGLMICRSIVEAHEGTIWAENNPDGGASFHFSLPVADRLEVDNAA